MTDYLQTWAASYKEDFMNNIVPFWMRYGLNHKNGGVYTYLDHDGRLMDTTKSVWFQGCFGFIAAYAYNQIEQNPDWPATSGSCIDFMEKHCFDRDGHMFFEVTGGGLPLRKRRYVFSKCFTAIAMSKYALASDDRTYAGKALGLFRRILRDLATSDLLEPKYLPTLQARGHSITMILINTAFRTRTAISDPILNTQISESIAAIRRYFIHPEFRTLPEMAGPDEELIDTYNGRVINPGRCVETAWFILEEARHRHWDRGLVQMRIRILEWSWEWGQDKEYDGIINFRGCHNFPVQDYSQDMKFR